MGRGKDDTGPRVLRNISVAYICAIDVNSLIDGLVHDVLIAVLGSFDEVGFRDAAGCTEQLHD